ncbi:DUF2249 domain-containing protein [Streptomyces hokutonensis]|uniref:DUF2249 domain-containing protein n=1 Tax=Streptomyces hokutonensis TaxID=1306990 RepID=UPI00037DC54D|nr:DUF2249 domain-containing protein [Streptomyces hokutonensis]
MTSSSGVYIQSTQTDPEVQARAVIRACHERLHAMIATLVEPESVTGGGETCARPPSAWCAGELRRHLAALDETLYAAAAQVPETQLVVRALRISSATLVQRIDALDAAEDSTATSGAAKAIEAVLSVHQAVEEMVLLPALAALPGAVLPLLVADFQTLLDGGSLGPPAVIDVRGMPREQRHPRIFARYARLAPGETFTLVNNHDPKPLRGEFEAAHPGAYTWTYVEEGPAQWQIRIGRSASHD